ncbi:MAG: FtsX-like permease family protein [Lachnospiraceae bacterium]|nr:FtsX-like permease family protein [Lachnospiraceae bacterium]
MLQIMLQKLLHKKWMVVCLLVGNILLVAVAASHPMYQTASLQRMLSDEFKTYLEENNEVATMMSLEGRVRKSGGVQEYELCRGIAENMCAELGVVQDQYIVHHNLVATTMKSRMERNGRFRETKLKVGSMLGLNDHVMVLSGRMYSDDVAEDGMIEAVLTMNGFIEMDLLVGEELDFAFLTDVQDNPLAVRIVGVVANSQEQDAYWVESPDSFESEILISPAVFEKYFLYGGKRYEFNTRWYVSFDPDSVEYPNAEHMVKTTEEYVSQSSSYGKVEEPVYLGLMKTFLANEKKVDVTLMILQVPVLVLLCAFLYMIARQMTEMEQAEISLMKSRGASKMQIFRLYLMQSSFLALIGFVVGLPFGNLICRILGSASAFLEFVQRRPLAIVYTPEVFLYALGAVLLSILMAVLPALKQSGFSIVHQKQARARSKRPLWQKLFLDVIILAMSLYGYYSFTRRTEELLSAVMTGGALDPLLFISSALFILGAALFCLRLQPLLVRFIYFLGKKRWKPAGYASFLGILRTGSRQYFIMTFLTLTVALGIFNTTVARTILANAQKNLVYHTGADLVVKEVWKDNSAEMRAGNAKRLVYVEPEYGKYGQIKGVDSMAKVYRNEKAVFMRGMELPTVLYGISTKDFGETTNLPEGLMEEHYYTYLNLLAENTNGVLLSSTFRDQLGYKVGDDFLYWTKEDEDIKIEGEIVGFVDYFPGFNPGQRGLRPDGTAYQESVFLIVTHLSTLQNNWGVRPYEIWFRMDSTKEFYKFAEENNIRLEKCVDTAVELSNLKRDTLFEGTNGILTMSFIVILILCGVGYLIYWILSIRSRELLFGIFRAMGMSRGEILRMLVNEQIFSSLLSIGCGAVIGVLASRMFVPMIQIAYSAANQVLPLELITQGSDMVRLFGVIGLVLIVCLAILARQVFRMKIAQALKLGED